MTIDGSAASRPVDAGFSSLRPEFPAAGLVSILFPGLATLALILPAFAVGPLELALRQDFAITTADVGTAFAGFYLFSAVFSAAAEWLSRRVPAGPLVRLSLFCSAFLALAVSFAPSRPAFILACSVAGVFNGLAAPALNLLIAQSVPRHRRSLAFGVKVAAVPLASMIAGGWALVLALTGIDWRPLYWVCAVSALGLAVGSRTLGGTVGKDATRVRGVGARPPSSLMLLAVGGLLAASGASVLSPFLVQGLVTGGTSAADAAAVLSVSSVLLIVTRVAVGFGSDRIRTVSHQVAAVAGLLLISGVGMAVLATGGPVGMFAGAAALALGFAWPGLLHHAALDSHPGQLAAAAGYMQTGTFLGAVVGPFCFGLTAHYVSFGVAWSGAAVTVAIAALVLLLAVRALKATKQTAATGE